MRRISFTRQSAQMSMEMGMSEEAKINASQILGVSVQDAGGSEYYSPASASQVDACNKQQAGAMTPAKAIAAVA